MSFAGRLLPQQPLLSLAARLYLRPPAAALLPLLATCFPQHPLLAQVDLDQARQEYNALFVVPVSGRYLPPYETAQRRQRLYGGVTQQVLRFYEATGFNPAGLWPENRWQPPPLADHVGLELAFICALLDSYRGAPAGERGRLAETVSAFWQQHLHCWLAHYGQQVALTATSPLYHFLGQMTQCLAAKAAERSVERAWQSSPPGQV